MARKDAIAKAEGALHEQFDALPTRKLIGVMCIVSLTLFISFIDQNGLSTALPTIAEDLHAANTISWAGTASLLANTTFQMLYGRLSDIFGRKTVYLGAVGLLAFADLLCGISRNATMLYISRGLAGIGGGGITNLSMIILSDVVTLEQRGKFWGITGSMIGLGSITGPLLAAAFAGIDKYPHMSFSSSWRGLFWLLAPLTTLAWILSLCFLPSKPPTVTFRESVAKIDWLGTLTSSVGIIFILIPVSGGGAYFAWDSPLVISFLAIGTLSFVLFVVVQWKVAKLPMMPVDIYRNRVVSVVLAQSFLLGLVYQSFIYYVPLYLQNAHRYSPIISAVLVVPMLGGQAVISTLSGLFISHFKRYAIVIQFGFGMWTLGTGLSLLFTRHTHPGIIIVILLVCGIGVGCVFQPTLIALQSHSPKSRRAVIISSRNFWRCAGGACGLSISAAVLQARLRATLPSEYSYLAQSTYSVPHVDGHGHIPDAVLDAYMAASHAVFLVQVPVMGVCFLASAWIRDRALEPMAESGESDQDKDAADALTDNMATRHAGTQLGEEKHAH